MLTFKNTNIFFFTLLLILVGCNFFYTGTPLLFGALVFIYSLILFYGCYYIGSDFFIKVHCSVITDEKQIAISFDDGPANNFTPQILQILKVHNVQAAFFCIGTKIAENELLLKRIHEEGHVIGNHSFSHHYLFDFFFEKKVIDDLKMTDEAIKDVIGLQPKLFRPPYGVLNPSIKKAILRGNYIPVGWSVRSLDTVIKDEKKLLDKISRRLKPGAVFLFHDTCKITAAILPLFIDRAKKNGYEIVRLDKMLHLQAYA